MLHGGVGFCRRVWDYGLCMLGMNTKDTGNLGESIACEFLMQKGFTIKERNYRKPWGEIDIIAEKGGIVRFVEVKSVSYKMIDVFSRETDGYRPEERVDSRKLEKISRTAETYMAEKHLDQDRQIDVVAVFLDPSTRKAVCTLYEGVV